MTVAVIGYIDTFLNARINLLHTQRNKYVIHFKTHYTNLDMNRKCMIVKINLIPFSIIVILN